MAASDQQEKSGYVPLRLSSGLRTAARRFPDATAIVADDIEFSYSALRARINRLANTARDAWSIKRGDVVALVAPNRPEYIEIVFALSDIGAIVATINPRLSAAELKIIFEDCRPRLSIVDPALSELVAASCDSGVDTTRLDDSFEAVIDRASDDFTPEAFPEEDSFCICYTSGTTGAPKGVLLSHRSRALTVQAMAIEYGCFGANDRFLSLAPLCHGAGFAFAAAAVSFGGACILYNASDPAAINERLCRGDVSGVFMVPTHFNRIYKQAESVLASIRDRHRLRTIISNAAALAQPLKEQTVAVFGEGLLHETYGSTEAGVVTNIRPSDILRKPNSVGVPFINTEIEIRSPDGGACAPGEIGELFSRGPYTFNGYLSRPEETAKTIRNGWVSVQDLASVDEEGFISIQGRMKDMVVSGGVNIYPAEIESVIEKFPGVKEAAVVGLPDAEWGERLHAFIVPANGRSLDAAAISETCRRSLAGYKVPRGFSFIAELPRNLSGKVLKRELRDAATQAGGATIKQQ